ncbi:hypothetical protein G9A89_010807 [Geosiphon pyriformis]|nr:hypothetical protein G9A89_010807 [Geosiphon pyriformis]
MLPGVKDYLNVVKSLQKFSIVFANQFLNHYVCFKWYMFHKWKKLDLRSRIPDWFVFTVTFIEDGGLVGSSVMACHFTPNIYTDGSVKGLGSVNTCSDAAAYFSCINLNVKSHSGIVSNMHADFFVNAATDSKFVLPVNVMYCFLAVKDRCISNAVNLSLNVHFDMHWIFKVWHPDGSAYCKKKEIVQVELF